MLRGSSTLAIFGALALTILSSACSRDESDAGVADTAVAKQAAPNDSAAPESANASVSLPAAPQPSWRTLNGDGYTLRYPAEATVDSALSESDHRMVVTIRGPRIHVPVDPNRGPSDGPAYRLRVSGFPNSSGATAGDWVESIRKAQNSQLDQDSLAYMPPPDTIAIGTVRALELRPFCGDCENVDLYLATPSRRVLVSYVFDIAFPGDREAQRRLYEAIVSTFQWKD